MSSRIETHRVRVDLAHRDRSTLLSLVSTLHRRGVDVVEAEFHAVTNYSVEFTATFLATRSHATTVVASLRNLVDVLDAELASAASATSAG